MNPKTRTSRLNKFGILFWLLLAIGCAKNRVHQSLNAPRAGVIDATSIQTVLASLKGESPENSAIVSNLVCHSGKGLDPSDPNLQAKALDRLRPQLHGRSVTSVATEVILLKNAETVRVQNFAKQVVDENRVKWRKRLHHIRSVKNGTLATQVIEWLGEPDAKASSPTFESWRYPFDSARNEEQIWTDVVTLKIIDGQVANVENHYERKNIADLMKVTHGTNK